MEESSLPVDHAEVGCSGMLFNDPYGIPVVQLVEKVTTKVLSLIDELRREQTERGLAFSEVMLAHLKVLLIFDPPQIFQCRGLWACGSRPSTSGPD